MSRMKGKYLYAGVSYGDTKADAIANVDSDAGTAEKPSLTPLPESTEVPSATPVVREKMHLNRAAVK